MERLDATLVTIMESVDEGETLCLSAGGPYVVKVPKSVIQAGKGARGIQAYVASLVAPTLQSTSSGRTGQLTFKPAARFFKVH